MSIRSLSLSTLSALLVFAVGCVRNDASVQNGTLEVRVAGTSESALSSGDGSFTITGVQRSLHTSLELSAGSPRGSAQVSLPPGLYEVQWKANPASARGAQRLPADGAARMVVIAAGSTTPVVLRAVPLPEASSAQNLTRAESIDARLALR